MTESRFDDEAITEIRSEGRSASNGPGGAPAGRMSPNDQTMIRRTGSQSAMAWLVPTSGHQSGRTLRLEVGGTVIGRDPATCQIVLDDESLSGMHAKVRGEKIEGRMRFDILDMGSLNGTFVNGVKVDRQRLKDGDRIRVGQSEFVFKQSVV